jgi:hypothetical protein
MNQNLPGLPDQQKVNSMSAIAELQRQVRIGASNFYWIAGLSMVNTLIVLFSANITFPIGLAITQIIGGIAYQAGKSNISLTSMILVISLLINLGIAGLFALFGFGAVKQWRGAYVTGMILYGLDALLMLWFADYVGLLFHLFFLWLLFNGLLADRKLKQLTPPSGPDLSFPKNIGMR